MIRYPGGEQITVPRHVETRNVSDDVQRRDGTAERARSRPRRRR